MFEEIAKRIHQVAEAWQYACEAGDIVQANFHRGELSQLVSTMQSAQQSVQRIGGILPANEPVPTPSTGSGIEYLRRQPTNR